MPTLAINSGTTGCYLAEIWASTRIKLGVVYAWVAASLVLIIGTFHLSAVALQGVMQIVTILIMPESFATGI